MSRDNNFDALRLALAVLVIYSHSFPLGTDDQVHEPLYMLTRGQLTFGGFAVDCFFIISGYLITQSWERSTSLWQYMRKRVARIYPGFIVAMIACWLAVTLLGNADRFTVCFSSIWDFACRIALLRDPLWPEAFATNPFPLIVNGSTWTIRYEFACYVALAALGLLGTLRKPLLTTLAFAFALAAQGITELSNVRIGGADLTRNIAHLARFFPLYLAGVVHYLYRERLPLNGKFALVALLGLLVAARVPGAFGLAFPVLGAYLVFYLAFSRHVRLYGFAKHGDFSYGTYLYAFPIQQLLVHWNGQPITPVKLFAIAAPLALLVGAVSWYCVERPFLRPRRKRVSETACNSHSTEKLPLRVPSRQGE